LRLQRSRVVGVYLIFTWAACLLLALATRLSYTFSLSVLILMGRPREPEFFEEIALMVAVFTLALAFDWRLWARKYTRRVPKV